MQTDADLDEPGAVDFDESYWLKTEYEWANGSKHRAEISKVEATDRAHGYETGISDRPTPVGGESVV